MAETLITASAISGSAQKCVQGIDALRKAAEVAAIENVLRNNLFDELRLAQVTVEEVMERHERDKVEMNLARVQIENLQGRIQSIQKDFQEYQNASWMTRDCVKPLKAPYFEMQIDHLRKVRDDITLHEKGAMLESKKKTEDLENLRKTESEGARNVMYELVTERIPYAEALLQDLQAKSSESVNSLSIAEVGILQTKLQEAKKVTEIGISWQVPVYSGLCKGPEFQVFTMNSNFKTCTKIDNGVVYASDTESERSYESYDVRRAQMVSNGLHSFFVQLRAKFEQHQ